MHAAGGAADWRIRKLARRPSDTRGTVPVRVEQRGTRSSSLAAVVTERHARLLRSCAVRLWSIISSERTGPSGAVLGVRGRLCLPTAPSHITHTLCPPRPLAWRATSWPPPSVFEATAATECALARVDTRKHDNLNALNALAVCFVGMWPRDSQMLRLEVCRHPPAPMRFRCSRTRP